MIVPGVGAYRIRPPNIPQGMNVPPRYVHSAPFGGVRDACQVCRVPGMRHAGVTFDPAAAACDMPALLSTQRPRHATCRGVRDACQVYQGRLREFPQVSRCVPWRLRRRRGVSRHLPRRLRKRRKSLGVCRGVCAGSASLSAFARPGFLTALPKAGTPGGMLWASSRRPTRGERRRRRGLHSARSAGC